MSLVKAQFVADFSKEMLFALVACAALAALWAGFRPDMVRDNDGRRLPPSVSARLTFVLLFVILYLSITAVLHFLPYFVKPMSLIAGPVANILAKDNIPIYGLLLLFSGYSIAPTREVERSLLAWMHSTSHLRDDIQALVDHLQNCELLVSPEEQRRNLQLLEELEVYVIDGDSAGISLASVTAWRKTASLLRHVRGWNAEEPRVLNREEMQALEEIEKAHGRKTRLAMDIVRMLEGMREGGDPARALTAVTDILARASHGNRQGVAELEAKAQASLESAGEPSADRPVRLSSSELQDYLKKIEGYFHVEYRLLLERISRLAAKSIMRAGDLAPQRLEGLKASGFQGLGRISPISTNRILWMFLSVAVGGFLIYYVVWYPAVLERLRTLHNITDPQALLLQGRSFLIGISTFVTCMAFAAMIGALFGSNPAQARASETPWGRYFVAGLVATVAFFLLQIAREFVILGLSLTKAPLTPVDPVARMVGVAPWFVLPFVTAFAICWLARQRHWSLGANESLAATLERVADGVVLGLLMLPGYAIAVAMVELIIGDLPKIFISRFDSAIMGILSLVGFLIGALVVRDVRTAAHAQVVAPAARKRAEGRAAIALTPAEAGGSGAALR
ncbi:MAG TPA: hypothetical protein VG900_04765 [Hyphomicrobiaceae bacterium]|nr:hypothetical protein [Hyphomicrobiaceae bacterium]